MNNKIVSNKKKSPSIDKKYTKDSYQVKKMTNYQWKQEN